MNLVLKDHIKIARPDHWVKNITVLLGAFLDWVIVKPPAAGHYLWSIIAAWVTCFLIASANYTINELVDADVDKIHPLKHCRAAACGKIVPLAGYVQWFLLALAGLILAWSENVPFFLAALLFFVMGLIYNVKPIRTKDIVYLDVLSESLNSPIRFLMGWYSMQFSIIAPVSLTMSFWMLAAFFMSVKRMAELKAINDQSVAAVYRKTFRYYNQEKLIASAVFYAVAFGIFTGGFAIKYRPQLFLAIPFICGLLAVYIQDSFKKDSITLYPEKLYKHVFLMAYFIFVLLIILSCFMVDLLWIKSFHP